MDTVKILYANRYRFPDKVTGEVVERATVQYLSTVQVTDQSGNTKGVPAVTVPCPYGMLEKLTSLPGDYHVKLSLTLDSRSRPQQRMEDATLVK